MNFKIPPLGVAKLFVIEIITWVIASGKTDGIILKNIEI